MKDSEFIRELKKYKVRGYFDNGSAKAVAFFMTPKQWAEFRRKFNSPIVHNSKPPENLNWDLT